MLDPRHRGLMAIVWRDPLDSCVKSPTPKQIDTRIRTLREARGMSQGGLAKQARITREYVNKLEAGRDDPTVGVLQRLAKALSVPVTELLE
jgi:ribosome-binding protein aMBF1 (putative translation factor)